MIVIDRDDTLLHANASAGSVLGRATDELLGRPVSELLPAATWRDRTVQLTLHDRHGARVLEGRGYDALPPSTNRIVVFQDVSDRARELATLVENERRFTRVTAASLDMVTETDALGRFTYASGACQSVLGYAPEELVGRSPIELHHPEDLPRFAEEMRSTTGSIEPFKVSPHRLRHKRGHWVHVEATGVRYTGPDGEERVLGVARDIGDRLRAESERHELQDRLLRSQKLESLGVLAGGIAHDFNNILTPIVGNAGLLLADLPDDSPARRWAEAIRTAGHRATALTTQMLTYAGQTGRQMTALDLSRVIEDVSLLLETTASKASRVHYELAPGLPALHGDSGQITQIVMNLVANASEALGDDGGRIGIGTRPVRADRSLLDRCYLGDARAEGDYVELSVSDDGEGLEADALEQIFDPFYTTRASSRGLGLAVVLGAVQAHDGAIQIESSHSGTCFRVLFPVGSAQRVEPAPIPERPEATAQPAVEGFLLVVDDDDGAREVTVTTLQRSGFDVLQASSGPQAIALFRRHAGDIAGVILDGTMPGMSGAHVFETLKGIDPEARVMLISGHAQERAAEALLSRGLAGFLHKPYEPDDLLLAIEQLLASG